MPKKQFTPNQFSEETKKPLQVLIVEDIAADAELIVQQLLREGFQIEWERVENETDYLKALKSPWDLILSDWALPQFSGMDALMLMQQRGLDTPFILVSEGTDEETAVAIIQQGAADYVLKDRMERLGQTIKNTLNQYRLKTEKRQAVEALAASEAELRGLFAAMRDVVLILDQEGVYLKVAPTNPGLLYKPASELLGKRLEDIFPPDQAKRFKRVIHKVLKTRKTQYIEYELSIRNRPVLFETSVTSISDRKVIWVARDITERKQIEGKLSLQAAALSFAANGILITDRNGTIEWANSAFSTLTGYSVSESIGKNPRDLVKSGYQDPTFYQKMWDTILKGEVWRGELINRRKNGEFYWEKLIITPFLSQDGQIIRFVAIKEDINQQRQNEDVMKARLRLHEFAIDHTLWELLQATLDEIENLTGSRIGFFHYLNADQETLQLQAWSTRTKEEYDKAKRTRMLAQYTIRQGEAWEECFRNRRPVIQNQPQPQNRKAAHSSPVPINRRMIVPIIRNDKIVAMLGVGNKASDYTENDIRIASRLADLAWDIKDIKVSNESLKQHLRIQEQISALGRELANVREIQPICRIAKNFLTEMTGSVNFSAALMNSGNQTLRMIYAASGKLEIDVSAFQEIAVKDLPGRSGYSAAICSRKPVVINEPDKISNGLFCMRQQKKQDIHTVYYLPLIADDQTIGLIELQSCQETGYEPEYLEWLSVAANQVGMSIKNGQLFAETQQRIEELETLSIIDSAVIEHLEPAETYKIILDEVRSSLKVDTAILYLFQPDERELICAGKSGHRSETVLPQKLRLGENLAGRVAQDRQTLHFRFEKENLPDSQKDDFDYGDYADYYGIPLVADSQLIGVLEFFHYSRITTDANWLRFLKIIVNQTEIAIKTILLYKNVQDANNKLLKAYDLTIEGWSRALDLRDKETENHTQRVTFLTVRLAQKLGIGDEQVTYIRRGALLHDIGKLGIPDRILSKAGPLTEEEWAIMHRHPQLAYEMLFPIEYLHPSLDIPYCHHEKWDGSGYPRGLKGEQIPLAARLFALADVYDALTSDRPYRKAWTLERTVKYIHDQSGRHFDPELTDIFLSLLAEEQNTGRK